MPDTPIPPALASFLANNLPGPWKAMAGIAVSIIEELPDRLGDLPQSLASTVIRRSMQAQQQYAEWVAKGEDFLGSLREPEDEAPPWATFDEDEDDDAPPAAAPSRTAHAEDHADDADTEYAEQPADGGDAVDGLDEDATADDDALTESRTVAAGPTVGIGPGSSFDQQPMVDELPVARRRRPRPARSSAAEPTTSEATDAGDGGADPDVATEAPKRRSAPARKTAAKKAPAKRATKSAPAKKSTPAKRSTPAKKSAAAKATATKSAAAKAPAPAEAESGPAALPEFDTLTIPQLRARLKTLKSAELESLLGYEEDHRARQPILDLLRNRLETLTS